MIRHAFTGQLVSQDPNDEPASELSDESAVPSWTRVCSFPASSASVDAMDVCTVVAEHMFQSTKGCLGVDDPVVTTERSEPSSEAARFGYRSEVTVELELAFSKRCLRSREEFSAEDAADHLDRQEEGVARRDPV